jgi:hypothetical protein
MVLVCFLHHTLFIADFYLLVLFEFGWTSRVDLSSAMEWLNFVD